MRKILLLTAAIAVGATFAAPVRAEDASETAAAPSAAPAQVAAPGAPAEPTPAPAAESKPAIPPDSEWVHPTK